MTILIYPECDTDLRKLIKHQPSNGIFAPQNFWFLIESCLNGMKVIADRKLCHNDIKPSNILLKEESDGSFEVFIADFGLCKADGGGTPGFASPECYSPKGFQVWKSDIYSFGKTLLYLLLGNLINKADRNDKRVWNQGFGKQLLKRFPILQCIKLMTHSNVDRRPPFESIYHDLEQAIGPEFDVEAIRNRLQFYKQKTKHDIPMTFENCNLDGTLGSLMTGLTINTSQPVSMVAHDQGDTHLCWAFSTATMIRSSLKIFLKNHVFPFILNGHHTINEHDTPDEYANLVEFLKYIRAHVYDDKFHRIVKHQLRRVFNYVICFLILICEILPAHLRALF